ncbi:diguanylate cyclase/phosphodiesterase with PAS/PAC sensor(s) [Shewanella denitrificans OS217]|uniref:Diguanylate cyclase/phosphodiesterase with PAS/PAC sensor(S) n=1 Tax=Shewanella denitrificans (strain OS217 / ATCC BAA-1090 / DSM 15013) TaxID=318161 RepID=Q12NF2_SHEDO|nr:diguanylate cyclase/phosphodiesterase with PAS/PAC sensor(s) [Shewanella denitrificans OS217]
MVSYCSGEEAALKCSSRKPDIEGYSNILSLVLAGAPLHEVLTALVLLIEAQNSGTKASVLLLSNDGKRLLKGAAPNLPKAYNDAIDGVEIGPAVGSCGTAAYLRERVIVDDIEHHHYWAHYKDLALGFGLKACWSEPIFDSLGEVLGTFAMYYDEVKSPRAEDLVLIEQAARLASLAIERNKSTHLQKLTHMIFNHLPMALLITNGSGSMLFSNRMFNGIIEGEELNPQTKLHLVEQDTSRVFEPHKFFAASPSVTLQSLLDNLSHNLAWDGELCCEREDGRFIYLALSVTPYRDVFGLQNCFAWIMMDVSDSKKANHLIQYQANNDALTGLSNRKHLLEKIKKYIHGKQEDNQTLPAFSLLQIDLDNFKQINDTLGHDNGDALLIAVADRLSQACPSKALLARLNGDEFALLLPNKLNAEELSELAQSINQLISERFVIDQQVLYTTVSIGIARYPADSNSVSALLNCASQAMYSAKEKGRNGFQFFDQQMQLKAERTAYIHTHIKAGLENNEFELYYQPIVNIRTATIHRAEVLLRWHHEGEFISPDEFIPVAEQTGFIVQLGEWVRKEAFKTIDLFSQNQLSVDLSVNVSTMEFWSPELQARFLASFDDTVRELGLDYFPYHMLTLEITESLMMQQHTNIANLLQTLRKRGIKVSVDDFGTGYSSLSYLVNFPVDQIKIDKAFVQKLTDGHRHIAIVEAIASLSRSLDLTVTAEGVETKEQLAIISGNQIDMVQGYYFYRPMPKREFLNLLFEQAGYGLL